MRRPHAWAIGARGLTPVCKVMTGRLAGWAGGPHDTTESDGYGQPCQAVRRFPSAYSELRQPCAASCRPIPRHARPAGTSESYGRVKLHRGGGPPGCCPKYWEVRVLRIVQRESAGSLRLRRPHRGHGGRIVDRACSHVQKSGTISNSCLGRGRLRRRLCSYQGSTCPPGSFAEFAAGAQRVLSAGILPKRVGIRTPTQ